MCVRVCVCVFEREIERVCVFERERVRKKDQFFYYDNASSPVL